MTRPAGGGRGRGNPCPQPTAGNRPRRPRREAAGLDVGQVRTNSRVSPPLLHGHEVLGHHTNRQASARALSRLKCPDCLAVIRRGAPSETAETAAAARQPPGRKRSHRSGSGRVLARLTRTAAAALCRRRRARVDAVLGHDMTDSEEADRGAVGFSCPNLRHLSAVTACGAAASRAPSARAPGVPHASCRCHDHQLEKCDFRGLKYHKVLI